MWEVATTDEFDAWFANLGEDAQVEEDRRTKETRGKVTWLSHSTNW
jgi:hypothetical protein